MQITPKSFQRLSSNPNLPTPPPPIGQRSVIYMITIDLQTFFKQFSNAKITVKEMEKINKLYYYLCKLAYSLIVEICIVIPPSRNKHVKSCEQELSFFHYKICLKFTLRLIIPPSYSSKKSIWEFKIRRELASRLNLKLSSNTPS